MPGNCRRMKGRSNGPPLNVITRSYSPNLPVRVLSPSAMTYEKWGDKKDRVWAPGTLKLPSMEFRIFSLYEAPFFTVPFVHPFSSPFAVCNPGESSYSRIKPM